MPVSEKKFMNNAKAWILSKGTSKVFNNYSPYNLVRLTNGLNSNFGQQYILVGGKLLNTHHARRVTNKSNLLNTFQVAANYPYLTNNKIKSAYARGRLPPTYNSLNAYAKNMNGAGYQNNFNNFNANGIIIELPKAKAPKKKAAPKKANAPKKKAAPKKANAPKKAGFFAGRLA